MTPEGQLADVQLPKWAAGVDDYVCKMRAAMESDYVSRNLPAWIDLIFGVSQCSFDKLNVFHPVTYEGNVDLETLTDPMQRMAFETQINEFGQTPKMIF